MEEQIKDLVNSGIAVEIMVPALRDDAGQIGVRLRTYGRDLPKNKMVMGCGPTLADAMEEACGKALAGRWENLNWAARPWQVGDRPGAEAARAWGLL